MFHLSSTFHVVIALPINQIQTRAQYSLSISLPVFLRDHPCFAENVAELILRLTFQVIHNTLHFLNFVRLGAIVQLNLLLILLNRRYVVLVISGRELWTGWRCVLSYLNAYLLPDIGFYQGDASEIGDRCIWNVVISISGYNWNK